VTYLNVAFSCRLQGSSLEKILKTGEPRIINDLRAYSHLNPTSLSTQLILKDGIRSSLTCPLKSGDKNVGVVFFSSFKTNIYCKEHVQTFLEISDELSVIIEHGRLIKDFENSQEQTRNLNMILHDLRSPLSVIQGFAEASMDEPWFDCIDLDGKNVFQIFLRNYKYMFELLNELNEISELVGSRDKTKFEEVQLKDFFHEMINFGKVLSEAKQIEFKTDTLSEFPQTVGFDRYKIRRVLDNLFSNAVKYSCRGSKIKFKIHSTPEKLFFSVRDYGLGIPVIELPKLFREFGKTSVRPTEGETSTGLGLAIAKRIVELHHGGISVDSQVGEGSTFSFWIPLPPT
jgi:hypothetical protein